MAGLKRKLLHKTLRYYVFFALAILIASAPVFYFTTQWLYERKTSKTLRLNKKEFYKYSLPHLKISDIGIWNKMDWNLKIVPFRPDIKHDTIFNLPVLDSIEHEYDPYRALMTPIQIENKPYTLMVRLNLIESDDIIKSTAKVFLGITLILLTGLYFITKRLSVRLWKPFYEALDQIEQFEINKDNPPKWIDTNIEEFWRLNQSVNKFIDKNIAIYQSQQEFIENAAHELQTPLAIFQAKLDSLLQTDHLSQAQAEIIEFLNQSIGRLNRLNKNLLLLSKLDHNQYAENETLSVNDALQKHLNFFSSQAQAKNIRLSYTSEDLVNIHANAILVDVMISNLLLNAVKFTLSDDIIKISLRNNILAISNTGQSMSLDTKNLFQRFSKTAGNSQGSGLGLAIVKKITEQYAWDLSYRFQDNTHIFEVKFNQIC